MAAPLPATFVKGVVRLEDVATVRPAEATVYTRVTADGEPAVTTDMIIGVNHPKLDGGVGALTLRGVAPANAAVRPHIHIVEGRMFEPVWQERQP